ncbi:hypothetical protein [Caldimonas sp. KR1-144]|uniref:hypothetical protein n=1 Tax=Caldimonas sp. KR1-144 TaxID=3400911 RepID=UPI003C0356DF
MTTQQTPSAEWRAAGEPDPHGDRYDCERAALAMGNLTDDVLANEAFLNYNARPPLQDLLSGSAIPPIAWMTAVKDRIRWLSRALEKAKTERNDAARGFIELLNEARTQSSQNMETALMWQRKCYEAESQRDAHCANFLKLNHDVNEVIGLLTPDDDGPVVPRVKRLADEHIALEDSLIHLSNDLRWAIRRLYNSINFTIDDRRDLARQLEGTLSRYGVQEP